METKKLGFGLMRLPTLENGEIDIEQVKQMADLFLKTALHILIPALSTTTAKAKECSGRPLWSGIPATALPLPPSSRPLPCRRRSV